MTFATSRRTVLGGMAGLAVTSLRELGIGWSVEETGSRLAIELVQRLGAGA